jgi:apolipoprotein N-acyltransferase
MQAFFASGWRYPLALLAGLIMPLGFAPFGYGPLAILGLAVIFAIVTADPWRTPKGPAYLFGLGYAGFGVYWIFISVSEYGGGPLAAALVTPIFIALFALYPLAALALGRVLGKNRDGVTAVVTLPLAWVFVEWVRSWLFTGATWLSVGYTQIDAPMAAVAPVFGMFGLSLIAALIAGLIAACLVLRGPSRFAALVPALALYLGPVLIDADWTAPVGEPRSVLLIQGNISQDQKWLAENRLETLRAYAEASRRHFGTDLIIWPETAVPAFHHQVRDEFLQPLAADAAAAGSDIVTGIPVVDIAREGAFNAVTVLGDPQRFYYKRHLVPFGEYVPFRDLLGGALDFVGAPLGDFNAGTQATILYAAGVPLGVSICYEITFGNEIADALPEAQVLVNVSNDAWFGDSLAPYQHLEMARMRALETGRPLLRATNTGITAFIDHRGEVTARAPLFEAATLGGSVQPRSGATPYVGWRDWPVACLAALGLLIAGVTRARSRPLFR